MKIRTQYKYDICDLTRDEFTVIRRALDCYMSNSENDWEDRHVATKIHKLLWSSRGVEKDE